MAEALGVTASTVSYYENGGRVPSEEKIAEYAEKLNVSDGWLSGQSVPRKRQRKTAIDDEEAKLLDMFRSLDNDGREYIMQTISAYFKHSK